MIHPRFAGHLVLRAAELWYEPGDTLLFFTPSDRDLQEPHDKENVGLNHIAFGVRTLEALDFPTAELCWINMT